MLGWNIISGAQISTNLLMWKICHIQLNYTEQVCGNLSAGYFKLSFHYSLRIYLKEIFMIFSAANDDVQQEVQKYANNFLMTSQWISSGLVH